MRWGFFKMFPNFLHFSKMHATAETLTETTNHINKLILFLSYCSITGWGEKLSMKIVGCCCIVLRETLLLSSFFLYKVRMKGCYIIQGFKACCSRTLPLHRLQKKKREREAFQSKSVWRQQISCEKACFPFTQASYKVTAAPIIQRWIP